MIVVSWPLLLKTIGKLCAPDHDTLGSWLGERRAGLLQAEEGAEQHGCRHGLRRTASLSDDSINFVLDGKGGINRSATWSEEPVITFVTRDSSLESGEIRDELRRTMPTTQVKKKTYQCEGTPDNPCLEAAEISWKWEGLQIPLPGRASDVIIGAARKAAVDGHTAGERENARQALRRFVRDYPGALTPAINELEGLVKENPANYRDALTLLRGLAQ